MSNDPLAQSQQSEPIKLLDKLAKLLYKQKGSDIILNANAYPAIKIDGRVHYIKETKLKPKDTKIIAKSLLTHGQWETFEAQNELNFMLDYPGMAHFRTNVFRQRGDIGLVLRLIPLEIPTLESLNLPDILKDFAMRKRGLVIFSGATGTGKSTSLAAMLGYRNSQRSDHIITVEDPIEFLHEDNRSIITQREVGIDTHSYAAALKSALRQAPDVILVGEIRDREVMEQALAFAETGHMVYATLHATTTKLTLERIVNMFPHERRDQLMLDLSHNLQAIVTQRLMRHASGKGRVAALEVMSNTPHIELLIRESRFGELLSAMQRSTLKEGVITIDNYIFELYEAQKITYEESLLYVDSPNNFRVRLRSDSKLPLPDELKPGGEADKWNLEKATAEKGNTTQNWGTFSKS